MTVLTVGVFRCVFDRTMSKKSAAVGTGAIAFNPLVDMLHNDSSDTKSDPVVWV